MASKATTRDVPPGVGWDGVGIFWSVLAIIWTCVLFSGMLFLWSKRNMPMLRIRSLPLSFGAVFCLHLYWLAVQLGYVYGALMPTAIEFWIMSIYFPFGIALFQASNSHFLHVSEAQKRFARTDSFNSMIREKAAVRQKPTLLERFKKLDYPRRVVIYVGIGMCFQVSKAVLPLVPISRHVLTGDDASSS
jgi:hypothetical protein